MSKNHAPSSSFKLLSRESQPHLMLQSSPSQTPVQQPRLRYSIFIAASATRGPGWEPLLRGLGYLLEQTITNVVLKHPHLQKRLPDPVPPEMECSVLVPMTVDKVGINRQLEIVKCCRSLGCMTSPSVNPRALTPPCPIHFRGDMPS